MSRFTPRAGRINSLWTLLLGGLALIFGLVFILRTGGPDKDQNTDQLTMYCAAGLRFPVEEIVARYQDEFGISVELQFGGSNSLLNQIEVNQFDTADLYLAADDFYTDLAKEKGLAAEALPIAHMRPVIAVAKGNPKQIRGIDDLLREDVSVVLANPDQAAVGRAARGRLQLLETDDGDFWTRLEKHVTDNGVFKPTVNDVASDIKLGAVDAGIVWDSTVAMPTFRDVLEPVVAPELEGDPNLVSICVLKSSPQPTQALKFARYLTARDRGLPYFEEFGTRPVEGDVWAERPEINFFCGAVNRRAVEEIVADFEKREDVTVNTIYDGCGILTSRMKTIEGQSQAQGFPDVYLACDVYYLENVKQWFQDAVNVSDTEIVIAVPKGSDKVKELADLIKPGVRVAIGQPDQCTIGALTKRMLAHEQLYDRLKEKQQQDGEVVVEKSSSALLVPDVTTGHVDAAVAYITDVLPNRDQVDMIRISSPLNVAIQPFSIAKTSDHKYLVRRLFEKVANSPSAFKDAGFHFRLDGPPSADEAPGAAATGNHQE